jgi:hypothetical protein
MWYFADLRFSEPISMTKTPQVRKYTLLLLINVPYNALICLYLKNLEQIQLLVRVVQYIVEISVFAICGLILSICGFAI